MRAPALLFGLALLFLPACSNNSSVKDLNNPTSPTNPSGTTPASFAGTWVGTATDSSGAVLGTAAGGSVSMTWFLTQSGSQVTGTMSVAGVVMPVGQSPALSGTVSGNTLNFTMTLPVLTSTMPAATATCSATATGVMTLNSAANAAGAVMSGTYSGSSPCISGFSNGQITMTRQ